MRRTRFSPNVSRTWSSEPFEVTNTRRKDEISIKTASLQAGEFTSPTVNCSIGVHKFSAKLDLRISQSEEGFVSDFTSRWTDPSMKSAPNMLRIGTRKRSSLMPYLFEHLIFEILTRVPVRDLIRFKTVCKQWRDLITSAIFQNQHLQVSIQRKAGYRLITVSGNPNYNFNSCSIESIYDDPWNVESEYLGHPLVDRFFCDWIVGSCNGLVCLRFQVDMIYLWNPSIREAKRLPSMCLANGLYNRPGAYVVCGFGYDKRNDDYKVLAIVCAPKLWSYETQVLIYTTKTDAWRTCVLFPVCGPHEVSGRLLNGSLHWAVPCSSIGTGFSKLLCIAAFDLETEKFREVPLPDEKSKLSNGRLGVLGDRLCVVCINAGDYNNLSLLVMKDYCVKESWTTLFNMHLEPWPTVVTPLWSSEKGELLLLLDQHMVLLDPTKWVLRHPNVENLVACAGSNVYIESFVSPWQN